MVDYLPNYKEKFAASVGEHADWDVDKHHKEVQKMMNKDGMKIKPIKQKISRTVGEELRPEIVSEMNEVCCIGRGFGCLIGCVSRSRCRPR